MRIRLDATRGPLRNDLLFVVLLDRLDQVLALDAEVHRDGRGDEHRRVDAEHDADRQRQREVVQRRSAEEVHGQRHAQRASRA